MSEQVQGPVEGPPEPSGRAPRRWSRASRPARFAVAGAGAAVVVIGVVSGLVLSGVVRYSAASGTRSSVGTYKSASLAYLGESPTTLVSGCYVVLIATELQPAITVLRT